MNQMAVKTTTVGDAAVDGLLGGVLAGAAMAAYLVIVNLLGGEGLSVLNRFDPNNASPGMGALLHLAVSGVYGVVFGIVWRYTRQLNLPAWLTGPGFGIALFIFAEFVLFPPSQSPLAKIPFAQFGIGHVIYGLVLGWSIRRNPKS